ncbi:probable RNA-binding protein EIF1AD [Anoplophora glabripennis]|uniref:probable RNA-binding protein EIF1AD n=1 Tax=Anoplophora glabripennis TaxID=217634 RepID=UPI0008748F93|nr:probable RNA-binding protein EIF1AD [Anoplophora glabripennis]
MSVSTLKNPVFNNLPRDDSPPAENQKIARVVRVRAMNLFEVETPEKSVLLMTVPNRFREAIWVRIGNFVVVEPIKEGNKVKVEMVKLLTVEQIWIYKMDNTWPKEFNICLNYLCVNTNRLRINLSRSNDVASNSDSEDDSDDSELTETCDSDYTTDSDGDSSGKQT